MRDDKTPQTRPGAAEPDDAPDKQRELKLNTGIGVLGTVLSVAVALIFFLVLDEVVLGVVFVVVALVALGITLRAAQRKRAAD